MLLLNHKAVLGTPVRPPTVISDADQCAYVIVAIYIESAVVA